MITRMRLMTPQDGFDKDEVMCALDGRSVLNGQGAWMQKKDWFVADHYAPILLAPDLPGEFLIVWDKEISCTFVLFRSPTGEHTGFCMDKSGHFLVVRKLTDEQASRISEMFSEEPEA